MFIISDNIAETRFVLISVGHLGFFIIGQRKKMETVGIYRCEKSSSIKISMNMTQNFDRIVPFLQPRKGVHLGFCF